MSKDKVAFIPSKFSKRPSTKGNTRLIRLIRLENLLRENQNAIGTTHLCHELHVSKRTLHRDIRVLRGSGMQVTYSKGKKGYSTELSGSLLAERLTLKDAAAIMTVLDGHIPRPETTYEESLRSAREKIRTVLMDEHPSCRSDIEKIIQEFKMEKDI